MHKFLLLFFLLLPFLEIYIFFQIASLVGLILTFLTLLFMCAIGIYILKYSSFVGFFSLNDRLKGSELQTKKIFYRFCVILGGVFLVFPGFLTDLISLFIFLPFCQNILYKSLNKRIFNIINQNINDSTVRSQVIDVDYVPLDEQK